MVDTVGRAFGRGRAAGVGAVVLATWPSTIPQCPLLNGFAEQKQINVVSFTPDIGPPKVRRRSTAASWLTNVTFKMTTTQLAAFNTFYETTLADGSLPFVWPHPVTKISYNWMFDPKDTPKINRATPKTFMVAFNLLRIS